MGSMIRIEDDTDDDCSSRRACRICHRYDFDAVAFAIRGVIDSCELLRSFPRWENRLTVRDLSNRDDDAVLLVGF